MHRFAKILTILTFAAILPLCTCHAKSNAMSPKEAKALFMKVYNMVFGKDGAELSYSVNIIGIYKTQGTIIYKGKKVHYKEKRFESWEDGVTAYKVDKKEKTVSIYRADDERKDKYLSKFKFEPDKFKYSCKASGQTYEITAKVKDASFFGIRDVTVVVNKATLYPQSLKIKLSLLRTTVKITKFKAGDISDKTFIFPKNQFAAYKYIDHRKD